MLMDAKRKEKGYASFFDWPDKSVKERGIVCDLLDSIKAGSRCYNIKTVDKNNGRSIEVECDQMFS